MDKVKVTETEEFKKLSVKDKAQLANEWGVKVGTILNTALRKANKFLKPYGYVVTIEMKFHELNENEE